MHAVRAGNLDGVLLAIAHGADVEEADMHGYRGLPLRTACFSGHYDIVLALLEHGANVNAPTAEGNGAPLRLARRAKHRHIASLLLERGAELPYDEAPAAKPLIEPMPTPVAEVTEKSAEAPKVIEEPAGEVAPSKIPGDLRRQPRPESNIIEFTSYAIPAATDKALESPPHGNSIEFSHSPFGPVSRQVVTVDSAAASNAPEPAPAIAPATTTMPDFSEPPPAHAALDAYDPAHIEEIEMSTPYGVDTDILARDLSRLAAGIDTPPGKKP
ncbi:MAG: ankyrin repeat domain-containing protein [Dechloromonas sp.]|nr:MAG: ankyrin repeat domain-containing protein [Dechloromonas sp.]